MSDEFCFDFKTFIKTIGILFVVILFGEVIKDRSISNFFSSSSTLSSSNNSESYQKPIGAVYPPRAGPLYSNLELEHPPDYSSYTLVYPDSIQNINSI